MNRFTGVWLVTGEHGVGKTSLGLEAVSPSKTLFVDDDLKGEATVAQVRRDGIKFGRYVSFINETAKMKALETHMRGLEIIESIEEDQYDSIIWDTWTRFASTCHAYVTTYPEKFRDNDKWAAMGKIRSGEEYKEARLYEAELIAELQRKAKLVILVSHLKNQYLNNAPTGKQIPAISKAVARVCNVRLWLRYNAKSNVPIGLVLKNMDRKVITAVDEEHNVLRTVQILPTKITPLPEEKSLWDSINRYYDAPAGLRAPTPDEIPDDFESSIVQGTLTEDQRLSWLYAIRQEKNREEEEILFVIENNREKAVEMREAGSSFSEIAKALEMSVKDVVAMLKDET